MSDVTQALPELDEATADLLQRFGFEADRFAALREDLAAGRLGEESNRIAGEVSPPEPGDLIPHPAPGSAEHEALEARGLEAIRAGEVAAAVLAGGMATRFGGVVKATVPVLDDLSFLDLKVRDVQRVAERAGGRVPIYLMSSFATDEDLRREAARLTSEAAPIRVFAQGVALRLRPDGGLFVEADGSLSPYAPGHGDLGWALRRSGALEELRAAGCRVLFMSNVDNLGATLDPAIVGGHLSAREAVTVEVVDKEPGDRGGAPARVDGHAEIVEAFRFPEGFDQDRIPVFNTNTLLFALESLAEEHPLTWFAVRKKVEGEEVVQLERLVGQLTAFLTTRFVRVPREGAAGRFLPVKDPEELEARRGQIEEALRSRGVL